MPSVYNHNIGSYGSLIGSSRAQITAVFQWTRILGGVQGQSMSESGLQVTGQAFEFSYIKRCCRLSDWVSMWGTDSQNRMLLCVFRFRTHDWVMVWKGVLICGGWGVFSRWEWECNGVAFIFRNNIYNIYIYIASWWFQPIWKILVKLDHFPK